jgi:iron complex transport system ATP-binding protein
MVGMGRLPYSGFWGTLNREDEEIVDDALQRVGIVDLQKRRVQTLSDGERQKVMIAKALAQQTPVIYLDEPTAFLDYPSKVEVLQLLRHISRQAGKIIFLSTHDVELALQLADTIWLMTRGEKIAIGSPQQLAEDGILSRFIEREGIVFDRETLTIRIVKK